MTDLNFVGFSENFENYNLRFLTGHSHLYEFSPLGTVLRTLPRRVEAEIVLLEVDWSSSIVRSQVRLGRPGQVGDASTQADDG